MSTMAHQSGDIKATAKKILDSFASRLDRREKSLLFDIGYRTDIPRYPDYAAVRKIAERLGVRA